MGRGIRKNTAGGGRQAAGFVNLRHSEGAPLHLSTRASVASPCRTRKRSLPSCHSERAQRVEESHPGSPTEIPRCARNDREEMSFRASAASRGISVPVPCFGNGDHADGRG